MGGIHALLCGGLQFVSVRYFVYTCFTCIKHAVFGLCTIFNSYVLTNRNSNGLNAGLCKSTRDTNAYMDALFVLIIAI